MSEQMINAAADLSEPFTQSVQAIRSGMDSGLDNLLHECRQVKYFVQTSSDRLTDQQARLDEKVAGLESGQYLMNHKLDRLLEEQRQFREAMQAFSSHMIEFGTLSSTPLTGVSPRVTQTSTQENANVLDLDETATHGKAGVLNIAETATRENTNVLDLDETITQENTTVLDLGETALHDMAEATVNPNDPCFSLRKNVSVVDVLDEWFVLTSDMLSIEERDIRHRATWRSNKKAQYKRKKAVINFLKKLRLQIDDGRLTLKQLAWMLDKYRERERLRLPTLIIKKLEKSGGAEEAAASVAAMWLDLSEEERREVHAMKDDTAEGSVEALAGASA